MEEGGGEGGVRMVEGGGVHPQLRLYIYKQYMPALRHPVNQALALYSKQAKQRVISFIRKFTV